MKPLTLLLEFNPAAHALLQFLAVQHGHASIEALVRSLIADEAREMGVVFADPNDPTVEEILGAKRKEGA